MLNVEVLGYWVEALESKVYPEGRGALCFNGYFCPLGVLCEVAYNKGVILSLVDMKVSNNNKVRLYDNCRANLPPAVWNWLGIRRPIGSDVNTIAIDGYPIIKMSDHLHYTHAEIAARLVRGYEENTIGAVKL